MICGLPQVRCTWFFFLVVFSLFSFVGLGVIDILFSDPICGKLVREFNVVPSFVSRSYCWSLLWWFYIHKRQIYFNLKCDVISAFDLIPERRKTNTLSWFLFGSGL